MRAYTVATVAVALNVSPKWIDNILTHHKVPGVSRARQGIARRLNPEAVTVLEIVLRLTRGLEMPIGRALLLATRPTASSYSTHGVSLEIDLIAIRSHVEVRLAEAVEFAPVPVRGRPRR
jgi:hypothetical protein